MLFLSRRPGEALLIGEDIAVTGISAVRGQVRLGIAAPRGVKILREELPQDVGSSGERNCTQLAD